MTDNLLGNGAVIERRSDLVTVDCLCRIVSQAYINNYILLVVYFLFLNAYVGSQQQILYLYSCLVVAGNFCHTASIRLSRLAIAADQIEKLCACCLRLDRKSTRLNSSHVRISYAVFCLKKKKKKKTQV